MNETFNFHARMGEKMQQQQATINSLTETVQLRGATMDARVITHVTAIAETCDCVVQLDQVKPCQKVRSRGYRRM